MFVPQQNPTGAGPAGIPAGTPPIAPPTAQPQAPGIGGGMEGFGLENMTDEEIQQLIALGAIDENMAENARQRQMAEKLRYAAAPEGRQAGRVFVAANPLEHIGQGLQKYHAMKEMKKLDEARKEMQGEQASGRKTYWEILRGMRKKSGG